MIRTICSNCNTLIAAKKIASDYKILVFNNMKKFHTVINFKICNVVAIKSYHLLYAII